MDYQARLKAPFGVLGIRIQDGALAAIDFLPADTPLLSPCDPVAAQVCAQLQAYLSDPHFSFDLPLKPQGTAFRNRVWQSLREIPAGETRSYGELAKSLHSAPRAVGQACGDNPIPIVIPCHRLVAKNGELGGFMHGTADSSLAIKQWLLRHERAIA